MKNKKSHVGFDIRWLAFFLCAFAYGAHSADTANYDTAWTFVYDGGKTTAGDVINDNFRGVAALPNGTVVCVGETRDTSFMQNILVIQFDNAGKTFRKKLLAYNQGVYGMSILIARNGDLIIGGKRSVSPLLVRVDSAFSIRWSNWYYDSTSRKDILARGASINGMVETQDGRILAIAGDVFPDNDGLPLNSYAALLEYDSLGKVKPHTDWLNTTGYELAGWSLAQAQGGGYMFGGKQSVFKIDTNNVLRTKTNYSFTLPGVGSELNNVSRVHALRDGSVMVAGQSYEEDCWTKYQRLYYDAWWSPLTPSGSAGYRYTAGVSGANDIIYDFTQLVNGNIVFVGKRQSFDQYGGIWAMVTDSTGRNILWQKQFRIPYKTADGSALMPWSVAASPDSGFTVVGVYGLPDATEGDNAFTAHFVPKPIPTSVFGRSAPHVYRFSSRKNWTFTFDAPAATDVGLDLFTVQGHRIARFDRHFNQAGKGEIEVDASAFKAGTYVWRLQAGSQTTRGFIAKAD